MSAFSSQQYPQSHLQRLEELKHLTQLDEAQTEELGHIKTMLNLYIEASNPETHPNVIAHTSSYSIAGLVVNDPHLLTELHRGVRMCTMLLQSTEKAEDMRQPDTEIGRAA